MRQTPSSWLNLLAKLGFKRKRRKKSRRPDGMSRRPRFEKFEDRIYLTANSANFDFDTIIDGADLAVWESNFGNTGLVSHSQGDADGDGDADGADFLFWQRSYGQTVSVVAAYLTLTNADFNEDNAIDGVDLAIWEGNFGTSIGADHSEGDADGDGDTDGFDFLAWQRGYGSSSPDPLGILTIDDTLGGVDQIVVSVVFDAGANANVVVVNGHITSIVADQVEAIVVRGGDGNDVIDLSLIDASSFANLVDGAITIDGGDGDDFITGAPLSSTILGGAGNDTYRFVDNPPTAFPHAVTITDLSGTDTLDFSEVTTLPVTVDLVGGTFSYAGLAGTIAASSVIESYIGPPLPPNNAPVLDIFGTMTFTSVMENDTNPPGNTVAQIIASAGGDRITDVDSGALEGIAVYSTQDSNGQWQYKLTGTNWFNFPSSVSSANAVLLESSSFIRFIPNADYWGGSNRIFFRAWDQTSGSNGQTGVNVLVNGGSTAFSTATESASVVVTPDVSSNNAPVLDNSGTMTLTNVMENDPDPGGNTVAGVIASAGGDPITDVDSGALEGIALIGFDNSNGSWQTHNGFSWYNLGAVSETSAWRMPDAGFQGFIRFLPNAGFTGTSSFTFRAWDRTNTLADTTLNGGNTAFSTAIGTATVTVGSGSPVNNAPVLDNSGTMLLTNVLENDTNPTGSTVADIITSAGGDRITDVDGGSLEGIAVIGANNSNGQWQYRTGVSWIDFNAISNTNAAILSSSSSIRFVPNASYSGTAGNLTFRAWDRTSGFTGQTGVNVSVNGGSTAFSTATEVATLTVLSVPSTPIVLDADFNGDQYPDELFFESPANNLVVELGKPSSGGNVTEIWGQLDASGTWSDLQVGDFNGDGRDDIAARNSSGALTLAISEGTEFFLVDVGALPSSWVGEYVGDFDGDGTEELLGWDINRWRVLQYDESTGVVLEDWGTAVRNAQGVSPSQIQIGDTNRDGRDDVIARNSVNGEWWVGLSQTDTGDSGDFVQQDWDDWFSSYASTDGLFTISDADAPIQEVIDTFSKVYNSVELELSPGLTKGVEATAQTESGNPWDQSALLVARLRAAGFGDAEIVSGTIEVPLEIIQDWIGAPTSLLGANPENALKTIVEAASGNTATLVGTTAIRFSHAWVEVQAPTATGLQDIFLDPSWKFKNRQPGILAASAGDLLVPFDPFDYLTEERLETPLEYYEDRVMEYLVENQTGASLADVPYDGPIATQQFRQIPAGMGSGVIVVSPGAVLRHGSLDEIWASSTTATALTHRALLTLTRLSSDGTRDGDLLLQEELIVPQSALRTITVTTSIGSNPQLHLGADILQGIGAQTITASGDLLTGEQYEIAIKHLNPGQAATDATIQSTKYVQNVGKIIAIGIDANQFSEDYIETLQANLIDELSTVDSGDIDDLLAYTVSKYWYDYNQGTETIAGLANAALVRLSVGSGIAEADSTFDPALNIYPHLAFQLVPDNMGVDLRNPIADLFRWDAIVQPGDPTVFHEDAIRLALYNGSALEHAIIEEVVVSESISTAKGLQRAFQRNLGYDVNGNLVTDDRVIVFDSFVEGGVRKIYWRGDWANGLDTLDLGSGPSAARILTVAEVTAMLADHAVSPGGANTIATEITAILTISPGSTTAPIRVIATKARSSIGQWTGGVYVAEYFDPQTDFGSITMAIQALGGTTMNGAFAGGFITPENLFLPVGTSKNQTSAGDPVNIANGNMFRDEVDFSFANLGVPLTFVRHYDSQATEDVGLGIGWVHSFSDRLIVDPEEANDILWIASTGERHSFKSLGGGQFEVPAALHGTFETSPLGYTYRDKNGIVYEFSTASLQSGDPNNIGRLSQKIDRNGDGVELVYSNTTTTKIQEVRDIHDASRRLNFIYSGDQIASVRRYDSGNLGLWNYTYLVSGANRYLSQVTYPTDGFVPTALAVQYQYDLSGSFSFGKINRITELNNPSDPSDDNFHTYEYYANGRVFRVTDSNGQSHTFNYNLFRNLTEFTDENGNTETYIHQDNGLLTKQIHDDRTRQQFTWGTPETPQEFLMTSSTDEVGVVETFSYYINSFDFRYRELFQSTAKHFVDSTGTPLNPSEVLVTQFDYSRPNISSPIINLQNITVDPTGANPIATLLTYDSVGRLLTTQDDLGNLVQRIYYSSASNPSYLRGLLQSETRKDQFGSDVVTTISYDAAGNITSTVTDGIASATNTYDTFGNLVTSVDAANITSHFTYDVHGRQRLAELVPNTASPISTSSLLYDSMGRLQFSVDPLGRQTEFRYDLLGSLIEQVFADGTSTTFEYDALRNRTSQTDALGRTTQFVYDNRSRLIQTLSPDGAIESVRYTGTGQIAVAIDARGSENQFSYDTAGRLKQITNADNISAVNAYDLLGNLISSTDFEGNTSEFKYDALGRVIETRTLANNPSDPPVSLSTFDYDPSGNLIQIAVYDTVGLTVTIPADPRALITTANKNANLVQVTETLYDGLGRVVEVIQSDGLSTRTTYDASGRIDFQYDELDRPTEFRYDQYGRLQQTELPDPDGAGPLTSPITTFQYDAAGNQTAIIDPRNNLTAFTYDVFNKIITTTNALGEQQQALYDVAGQLVATANALGHATYTRYDERGRIQSLRLADPDGSGSQVAAVTKFEYDVAGNLVKQTDPRGFVTQFDYDALNRLEREEFTITVVDPSSTVTNTVWIESLVDRNFTYDDNGNLLSETDTLGRITNYVYDELGRLKSVELPDPNDLAGILQRPLTTTQYDGYGNILSTVEHRGGGAQQRTTTLVYDRRNRLVSETIDAGNENIVTNFQYDAVGNLELSVEAVGTINARTEYDYDDLNRLVEQRAFRSDTDTSPLVTQFEYDANGNLTESIEIVNSGALTHQVTTQFSYDALNRQTSVVNDLGGFAATSSILYDTIGNVFSQTNPLLNVTTNEYDRLSRLIKTTAPDPDGAGPLQSSTTVLAYDIDGSLLSQTNGENETVRFVYDSLGRTVRSFDALDNESRSQYDSEGNLTSFTDPNGNETTYSYDDLNRLEIETIVLSSIPINRTYKYNDQGNLEEAIDRNGRKRTFTYDRLDRLTREDWLDPALVQFLEWQYDDLGRVTLSRDSDLTTAYIETFVYDDLGRILEQRNFDAASPTSNYPQVRQSFQYDVLLPADASQIVHTIYSQYSVNSGGSETLIGTTDYFTDQLGRLAQTEDAQNSALGIDAKEVVYTYDLAGQLQAVSRTLNGGPFQLDTSYDYDNAGRVTSIDHQRFAANGAFSSSSYQYDRASRIVEQNTVYDTTLSAFSALTPNRTKDFQFDEVGQLEDVDINGIDSEDYAYDDNGNRSTGTVIGPYNRLLENGTLSYAYDNEGNLTQITSQGGSPLVTYTWDQRNRLVQVVGSSVDSPTTLYRYNASDQKVFQDYDSNFTGPLPNPELFFFVEHFIYNGNETSLTLNDSGQIKHRYQWGPGVDQLVVDEVFDSAGQVDKTLWAVTDYLGSVNDLIDADTHEVVEHREYDSFGNILQVTDETGGAISTNARETAFAFAGRQFDDPVGLAYNDARWYDPNTGRFISEDPIGFGDGPNVYRYAGNDPVNFRDPTGLFQAGNPLNDLAGSFGGSSFSTNSFDTGFSDFGATPSINDFSPSFSVDALGNFDTFGESQFPQGSLTESPFGNPSLPFATVLPGPFLRGMQSELQSSLNDPSRSFDFVATVVQQQELNEITTELRFRDGLSFVQPQAQGRQTSARPLSRLSGQQEQAMERLDKFQRLATQARAGRPELTDVQKVQLQRLAGQIGIRGTVKEFVNPFNSNFTPFFSQAETAIERNLGNFRTSQEMFGAVFDVVEGLSPGGSQLQRDTSQFFQERTNPFRSQNFIDTNTVQELIRQRGLIRPPSPTSRPARK